ncbi:MAG: ATP-binding cassette domain-containing protein [Granulosicoccus sp.]
MSPGLASNALYPLVCDSVSYCPRGKLLLNNISLCLKASGVTVIMGFNGAGKSLLLRLMHGLIQPTAGTISWNGKAVNERIRQRQAMVFQQPVLLRRTVMANLEFVLKSRGMHSHDRCDEMLELVGMGALGLRSARQLSGGEQQRLALARALICEPDTLFLDEATASLDPGSVAAIEQIVRQANQRGVGIIFITHDVGQARRMADNVVFLHEGQVAELGPAGPFFDNPVSQPAQAYLDGRLPPNPL